MTVNSPDKPRKHRWITEAIKQGEATLSVWPSEDEIQDAKKQEKFLEVISKIGNDPRVVSVRKASHPEYNIVYLFEIENE